MNQGSNRKGGTMDPNDHGMEKAQLEYDAQEPEEDEDDDHEPEYDPEDDDDRIAGLMEFHRLLG